MTNIRLPLLHFYKNKMSWVCVASTQETDACLISFAISVQTEEPRPQKSKGTQSTQHIFTIKYWSNAIYNESRLSKC